MTQYTILYIEDNDANLQLMQLILARRPEFSLVLAETGGKGLELAKTYTPDLILLDLSLPDLDGPEVMKLLAMEPSTSNIPIIILSGNFFDPASEDASLPNYFSALTKPVDVMALYNDIDRALSIEE